MLLFPTVSTWKKLIRKRLWHGSVLYDSAARCCLLEQFVQFVQFVLLIWGCHTLSHFFTLFARNTSFPMFVFPLEVLPDAFSMFQLLTGVWSPWCLCFSNLPNHQYHLNLCFKLEWCCHLKEACSMIQLAAWWNRFTYVRLLQLSQLLQTKKCQIKNNFATPALRFLSNK